MNPYGVSPRPAVDLRAIAAWNAEIAAAQLGYAEHLARLAQDEVHGCGTPAAYKRHERRHEPPCRDCRDAYNADKARRRREARARQRRAA